MRRDPEGMETKIIAELLWPSAGDLLEIGCGDGRLTVDLDGLSRTLTALDPVLVTRTTLCTPYSTRARFLRASGEDLPFDAHCFDTIVFTFSLHHQAPVRALGEARRVLRSGGRILVLEPVEHSLISMLFSLLHDESHEYERAEVAIEASGLKEMQSGSFRTLWIFEDFGEMVHHLFEYFGLSSDAEKEKDMARLLGDRCTAHPLAVEDITRYWLLQLGVEREGVSTR